MIMWDTKISSCASFADLGGTGFGGMKRREERGRESSVRRQGRIVDIDRSIKSVIWNQGIIDWCGICGDLLESRSEWRYRGKET